VVDAQARDAKGRSQRLLTGAPLGPSTMPRATGLGSVVIHDGKEECPGEMDAELSSDLLLLIGDRGIRPYDSDHERSFDHRGDCRERVETGSGLLHPSSPSERFHKHLGHGLIHFWRLTAQGPGWGVGRTTEWQRWLLLACSLSQCLVPCLGVTKPPEHRLGKCVGGNGDRSRT
jgi:hypothetical protein